MTIHFETMEEYQGKALRGDNPCGHMSSHSLADFAASPARWKAAQEREPQSYFGLGTAWHTLVGEGFDEFLARHPVGEAPPVNEKTGKEYGKTTKKYKEWLSSQPEGTLTPEQEGTIYSMHRGYCENSLVTKFDDGKNIPEAIMRGNIDGVACQGRFDWWRGDGEPFIDFKTTRSLDGFKEDFKRYHYAEQMGFYFLLAQANGYKPTMPQLIVTESTAPYRTQVFLVCYDTLADGISRVKESLHYFRACQSRQVFPTQFAVLDTI